MARPEVSDVGKGLRMWGVAANILYELRTAENECPFILGVGREADKFFP